MSVGGEGGFYHSNVVFSSKVIGGRSDGLPLTNELINEFRDWVLRQGVSERTVRDYVNYLRKAVGITLSKETISEFFERAGFNKRSYEALSRFLTFLSRVKDMDDFVMQVKKAMPRKPRTTPDTRVPSNDELMRLREAIILSGSKSLTVIYNVLVSSGCRLSEAYTLVKNFNKSKFVKVSEEYGRYHIDLVRGSKNVYVIYLPTAVVRQIEELDERLQHPLNIAKAFEKVMGAKYIRKWFRQTCKKLKIDSELIEFIQGRVSALGVGAKHYTDLIALTDEEYRKILEKVKPFLIL